MYMDVPAMYMHVCECPHCIELGSRDLLNGCADQSPCGNIFFFIIKKCKIQLVKTSPSDRKSSSFFFYLKKDEPARSVTHILELKTKERKLFPLFSKKKK